jgi:hypothetical protein
MKIPRQPTRWSTRPDTGSVTLFLVITVTGLLVMAGLVVDGGAKIRGIERADTLAAEAGRAAGQAINISAAITGSTPTLDPRAAIAAADAYLATNGVTGTVAVTAGGRSLEVTVTTSTPTVFLGLIGITAMTSQGHATVALIAQGTS